MNYNPYKIDEEEAIEKGKCLWGQVTKREKSELIKSEDGYLGIFYYDAKGCLSCDGLDRRCSGYFEIMEVENVRK